MALRRLLLASIVLASLGLAETVLAAQTLKWEDLAPPWDDYANPVDRLSQEQQDDIYVLLWGPNYGASKDKLTSDERAAYDRLKASGVDPEIIFGQIEELRKKAQRNDKTLIFELDKKTIKLPGYVLPLDFDGKRVKSFLLVPTVGACIHVPPPPPNQMVFVEPDEPFISEELYAPVWVTGQITVGMGSRSLSLVDGSSDVDFGYSMRATKIEPYTGQ